MCTLRLEIEYSGLKHKIGLGYEPHILLQQYWDVQFVFPGMYEIIPKIYLIQFGKNMIWGFYLNLCSKLQSRSLSPNSSLIMH